MIQVQSELVQAPLGIDVGESSAPPPPSPVDGADTKAETPAAGDPKKAETLFTPAPANEQKIIEEYGSVGQQVLEQSIKHAQKEQETAKKSGQKAPELPAEQKQAIQALNGVNWFRTTEGTQVSPTYPRGIPLEGNPLIIKKDGQEYQVRFIKAFKGDMVDCLSANGTDVSLPREALISAAIISEETALTGYVPTTERAALKGYIDILKANVAGQKPTLPDTSSRDIAEASVALGRVTSSSLAAAIKTATEAGTINEETAQSLMSLVNGTTVATPEAVGSVVHTLNNIPATITALEGQKSPITNEIENQKRLLKMASSDQERASYSQEIVNLERQLHRLELTITNLQSLPQTEQEVQTMFIEIYAGKIPLANPSQVDRVIREGANVNELHQLIDESKLTKEEKEKYGALLKYAGMGGLGLLAILALMIMRAVGEK